MTLSKQEFSSYIKQFRFRELFNDMGWNNDKTKLQIIPDENTYTLQAVAEKSGFKILVCPSDSNELIPDYNTRKKIETKVTKLFHEHLIIFHDKNQQEQIWQLVVRQTGKPTKVTETRYNLSQDPELLYQRASGLFFEMDEEENITIVDVTQRVAANFHQNAEKVTKHFYDRFKKEHNSFLGFIKGIETKVDKDWYASLMLNRLMFCYFIQKKGFLDDNKNYLREKLKTCREKKGQNKFYSFYRDFLLVLFHEGLNEAIQKEEVKVEIGKIPYLNGGLFDEHELEKMYNAIDIADDAFERVFDFFDQYEWHLDTRVTASGKDINPDVIGYIFEKYINERAQMGAYYTKEDITEYISKNTVLPYLFDEIKRNYPKAFVAGSEIWSSLKESGDDYIYDAVKCGINPDNIWGDLPEEIQNGLEPDQPDLVEKRKAWNKKAPSDIALPTEIFREVIDRRKRYAYVKSKIENGEITQINDFITYNLNIRQFVQDVIENTGDPDFLRQFYKALNTITILDPTCGSGAFLFAAMNILEPLYEACIMRMRGFVEDEDRLNEAEKKSFSNKYKFFRQVLAETQSEHHPNLQYFIFKSIILQNLYGVDIMREAVEIAKLRLFLKLVATVDADYRKPNLGLEPLPDIDFNIRAGNTLVGFATEKELEKCLVEDMMGAIVKQEIEENCDIVARTFTRYKEIQLRSGDDYSDFKVAKEELSKRLKELNNELNQLLHKQASGLKYEEWLASHQPFHWFAEFYEIIHDKGGFDVIIGNPPYVEYSKVKKEYTIKDFKTEKCGNIYAFIVEKIITFLKSKSRIGLIIPISIISTDRTESIQKLVKDKCNSWYSNFDTIPGRLFGKEVEQRLTVSIMEISNEKKVFSSYYKRFSPASRDTLFNLVQYIEITKLHRTGFIPRISNQDQYSILKKIKSKSLNNFTTAASSELFYIHRIIGYYTKAFDFIPHFKNERDGIKKSEDYKAFNFQADFKKSILSLVNSGLFYWWWHSHSDGFHCGYRDVYAFPFDPTRLKEDLKLKLDRCSVELMEDLKYNSEIKIRVFKKTGIAELQEFEVKKSKPIIDEIDKVLADHYGFTEEELDFIINYDIKYRMGKELENMSEL